MRLPLLSAALHQLFQRGLGLTAGSGIDRDFLRFLQCRSFLFAFDLVSKNIRSRDVRRLLLEIWREEVSQAHVGARGAFVDLETLVD